MHTFDLILIIILTYNCFKGFIKGFIYQIYDFFVFLFMIYLIINYSLHVGQIFNLMFNISDKYLFMIGAVLIFLITIIVKIFVYKQFIKENVKSLLNNILGLLLSMFKSLIIISFFIFLINHFEIYQFKDIRNESFSFKLVENIFPTFKNIFQINIPKL